MNGLMLVFMLTGAAFWAALGVLFVLHLAGVLNIDYAITFVKKDRQE